MENRAKHVLLIEDNPGDADLFGCARWKAKLRWS